MKKYLICALIVFLATTSMAAASEITGTLSTDSAQTVVNATTTQQTSQPQQPYNWEFTGGIILGSLIALEILILILAPRKKPTATA